MVSWRRVTRLFVTAVTVLVWVVPKSFAQRQPVEGRHGMVASASAIASGVGREVLEKGGNAVDAAVAVGLTLAVTYPRAGNLGGGGFMVLTLADGRATTIDYRETAPSSATEHMYLDASGKVVPNLSLVGYKASGVPGTVAGLALALERYGSGKFRWADLVQPALHLARDGFPVSQTLAKDLQAESGLLAKFPESRRIFLRDGSFYQKGEIFRQPELADTLAALAHAGPREFYEGTTAVRIADDMAAHDGLITRDDLKRYRAIERPALIGHYRDYEIVTMPPPSSGGVALLQMLAMLEPRDVGALGTASSAKYHLFAEVMRRAYRDRAEYLGDPDFVSLPIAGLVDPAYARGLMHNFDPNQVTSSEGAAPASPTTTHPGAESTETTHFSIVDEAGNAVSNTYTLNGLFGSGVTVPGTGVLLNNEMDDFAAAPNSPNLFGLVQGPANAIAPNKRPLSSMTPTIVRKNGAVSFVTGSPGGATIINTVLIVLTGVIDHGLNIAQAVEQPRVHHQWLPDLLTYEPNGLAVDVMTALQGKGHRLSLRSVYGSDPRVATYRFYWGDAESVAIDPTSSLRLGASDPRSPDAAALGY
jgi:gamma-glutamyltranspeptidase/glutathione hydrolase